MELTGRWTRRRDVEGVLGLRCPRPTVFRGHVIVYYAFIKEVLLHHSDVRH